MLVITHGKWPKTLCGDNLRPMIKQFFDHGRGCAGRCARRRDGHDRRLRQKTGNAAELIDCLIAQGAKDLTVVNNNAGNADAGLAALIGAGRVRKTSVRFRARPIPGTSTSFTARETGTGTGGRRVRSPSASAPGRRHRRVFSRLPPPARNGRGQETRQHRRPRLRALIHDPRRLRDDQGGPGRSLGQPHLPQDRAQFGPIMASAAKLRGFRCAKPRAGRTRSEVVVNAGIFVKRVSAPRPGRKNCTASRVKKNRSQADGGARRAGHTRGRLREPRIGCRPGRRFCPGPRYHPPQRKRRAGHRPTAAKGEETKT